MGQDRRVGAGRLDERLDPTGRLSVVVIDAPRSACTFAQTPLRDGMQDTPVESVIYSNPLSSEMCCTYCTRAL